MGTSTVSGPFRSANGFQQLDENGVWVPVTGGGGGGGGITSIIIPNNTTYPQIPIMTVGQTIALAGGPDAGGGSYEVLLPIVPGTYSWSITSMRAKMSYPYNNEFYSITAGNGTYLNLGGGFSISGSFYFLLTYVGIKPTGMGAPFAEYRMFGMG